MRNMVGLLAAVGLSTAIVIGQGDRLLHAQNANDPNAAPNPYRMEELRVQMPDGRKLGAPIGVEIDHSDGKTLWLFERCGGDTCVGSTVDPVMKLDANAKVAANFGGGLINWPHGFYVDRAGDVWVTDGRGENGKGHTVIKFAPDGKVLMTLGKPGQAGDAPGMFDTPSDVIIASNGDILVADGHGVLQGHQTNDRIVKLSKDGTFITAWGKHGSGRGEFDVPHSLALDSAGLLYVGDRSNNIPLTDPAIGSAEELAIDDQGNVFAGFTAQGKMAVRRFVKN